MLTRRDTARNQEVAHRHPGLGCDYQRRPANLAIDPRGRRRPRLGKEMPPGIYVSSFMARLAG